MARVLECTTYDEATASCTAQAWVEQDSAWPALSIADAQAIGLAIAYVWALAFVFRLLIRFVRES